ncbi:MAG: hypothetical protein U1E46_07310 [Hyphomicrobiales bacterium]
MTFGKRKLPPPGATPLFGPSTLLPIYVRSAHRASDGDLVQDVVDFVEIALNDALFHRDEFPVEAMQSYHVHYYFSLVEAGGHGHFLHESRWGQTAVDDIEAGLERMELWEALGLFRELVGFARHAPHRFMLAVERGNTPPKDELIRGLDQRFAGGVGQTILKGNADFLRSLACVKALTDSAYDETMGALALHNPNHAVRKQDRERLVAQQRLEDPVFQGLAFICQQSRSPPIDFFGWKATDPASDQQTGERGMLFWVDTTAGPGRIVLFRRNAYLYFGNERNPRVVAPMASVEEAARKRTGMSFLAALSERFPEAAETLPRSAAG